MPLEDAFCKLPDPVVCLILSKISIREAVRCSILSRRWRFLYTQIPQLTFSADSILGWLCPDPNDISRIETIISNILRRHSSDVESFSLYDVEGNSFARKSVWEWVRYVAGCNVQHLALMLKHIPRREMLPPAVFSCTRLTTLKLCNYILLHFPPDFNDFHHLLTCCLFQVQLTDESLAHFISICPLLRKLEIICPFGLKNAVIAAANIEQLIIHDDLASFTINCLTVNCPKLSSLDVYMIQELRVSGLMFSEISHGVRKLEIHGGNSMKRLRLELDASNVSPTRFVEIVGIFQSLKVLDVDLWNPFKRERTVDAALLSLLLERLPNLETLSIMGTFLQELARDPIPIRLTSPHVNLKNIWATSHTLDETEIEVLGCLLQNSPALEIMVIDLGKGDDEDGSENKHEDEEDRNLVVEILESRKASEHACISVF